MAALSSSGARGPGALSRRRFLQVGAVGSLPGLPELLEVRSAAGTAASRKAIREKRPVARHAQSSVSRRRARARRLTCRHHRSEWRVTRSSASWVGAA
jgi:hypothetical protein